MSFKHEGIRLLTDLKISQTYAIFVLRYFEKEKTRANIIQVNFTLAFLFHIQGFN